MAFLSSNQQCLITISIWMCSYQFFMAFLPSSKLIDFKIFPLLENWWISVHFHHFAVAIYLCFLFRISFVVSLFVVKYCNYCSKQISCLRYLDIARRGMNVCCLSGMSPAIWSVWFLWAEWRNVLWETLPGTPWDAVCGLRPANQRSLCDGNVQEVPPPTFCLYVLSWRVEQGYIQGAEWQAVLPCMLQ